MSTQSAARGQVESPLLVDRQNMPYELADEIGYRCRIALIVLGSDRTIEHEFRKMLDIPGVAFYESRIHNDAEVTPEPASADSGFFPIIAVTNSPGRRLLRGAKCNYG